MKARLVYSEALIDSPAVINDNKKTPSNDEVFYF